MPKALISEIMKINKNECAFHSEDIFHKDDFFNKRKHTRIDAVAKVDVYDYYTGKFMRSGYILDISLGGLKIGFSDNIGDVEVLFLKFVLSDKIFFDGFRAKVIRIDRDACFHTYGLKFIKTNIINKIKLRMCIKRIFQLKRK